MRRFYLNRVEDATGVSGIGRIAEGVEFDTGDCVILWLTAFKSVCHYECIKAVEHVHGHGGRTKIEWLDSDEP